MALIRSVGSSQKGEGAGGSFGIGKNAPFAASALRTVLYSTKLADESVAFQGVARLVTHKNEAGKPTQGTGYYGETDPDGYPISIRTEKNIPAFFRRKEQGTDVHIVGYMGDTDWKKQLERATLEHFWPALSWGKLVVEIGDDITLNSETLPGRMSAGRLDYEEFYNEAYAYYDAYTNTQAEHRFGETLPLLKEVSVAYRIGEANLTNRVAMIRQTGMVIYKHAFKGIRLKFAGAFVCVNETGNTILRNMEPPRHDEWDVDRPEKGGSRKYQHEYRAWLRKILVELAPKIESKTLEVDELADYLPDSPVSESGGAKGNLSGEDANAFTDMPDEVNEPMVEVAIMPARKPQQPDETSQPDNEGDGRETGDGESGTGQDSEPSDGKEGKGDDYEKPEPPAPTGSKGGAARPSSGKNKQSIATAKAFADTNTLEYVICLRSEKNVTVNVRVSLVGEDAFTEEISLQGARDRDTNQTLGVNGNKVDDVELVAGQLRRVAVLFGESVHYAINIEINEV